MKLFTPPPIIQRVLDAHMQGRYGDVVHEIAQPVAKLIDRFAGTDLQNCGGCAERRKQWNAQSDTPPPTT